MVRFKFRKIFSKISSSKTAIEISEHYSSQNYSLVKHFICQRVEKKMHQNFASKFFMFWIWKIPLQAESVILILEHYRLDL